MIELLTGFEDDFWFSPAKAAAVAMRNEAMESAPALAIVTRPAGAAVSIDGTLAGAAPLERHVLAGPHTLHVEAKGHEPLERDIEHAPGGEPLVLTLVPRPVRVLELRSRIKNVPLMRAMRDWRLRGVRMKSSVELAGMKVSSDGSRWGSATRTLPVSSPLFEGAAGWRLTTTLAVESGAAEILVLAGAADRQVAVGVSGGRVYLGERRGDELERWFDRPAQAPSVTLCLSWHGDVLVVHEGLAPQPENRIGAIRPAWRLAREPTLDIAVQDGAAVFSEMFLYPLF